MASAKATTNHDEIRKWVEARGGFPAHVRETGSGNDLGVLRIDYPGFSGQDTLEHIEWDQWFDAFDRNNLAFLYQGGRSRFSKLVDRGTSSKKGGAKKRAGSKKASSSKKASAKKASAKKASASRKRTSATKRPAKRGAAKRSSAKRTATARPAKRGGAKRGAAKRSSAKRTSAKRK